jgi:chaperonin GroES
MVDLQPINENVLLEVEQEAKEAKTASGLIIPGSAAEKKNEAKVVAVGTIENAEVSVGDIVIYKAYAGTTVSYEGKDYLLLPYADVIGKVVETEAI